MLTTEQNLVVEPSTSVDSIENSDFSTESSDFGKLGEQNQGTELSPSRAVTIEQTQVENTTVTLLDQVIESNSTLTTVQSLSRTENPTEEPISSVEQATTRNQNFSQEESTTIPTFELSKLLMELITNNVQIDEVIEAPVEKGDVEAPRETVGTIPILINTNEAVEAPKETDAIVGAPNETGELMEDLKETDELDDALKETGKEVESHRETDEAVESTRENEALEQLEENLETDGKIRRLEAEDFTNSLTQDGGKSEDDGQQEDNTSIGSDDVIRGELGRNLP
jgi:hypothetical protein